MKTIDAQTLTAVYLLGEGLADANVETIIKCFRPNKTKMNNKTI